MSFIASHVTLHAHCTSPFVQRNGFRTFIASCREYISSRTHPDSEAKLWIHKYTEVVLNVKVVCQHNVHGIEIQIPSTSGDNQFGWSYPEAQIATWMSYDTENQKILLKTLLQNVRNIKRKNIPKVKGEKTIFLIIKEFGRTCQPMNTVGDTLGKPKSRT